MNRRRLAASLLAGGALFATAIAPRLAHAVASVEHEPGGDSCERAATYFPEDDSEPARRARLSCRREVFARQMEEDRRYEDAQTEDQNDKVLDTWMKKQNVPARMFRRNAVDLFAGGGLMSFGIAGSWLLAPEVEAELWFGRRNVSDSVSTGYFQDSRSCIGARLKWLMRSHGSLTPLASVGAADCWANVALLSYGIPSADGTVVPPGESFGSAAAHVATGSLGLAWTDKTGVRASAEYVFTYAFYTQATLMDDTRTQDAGLRTIWNDRLTSERGGVRLQVGYAF